MSIPAATDSPVDRYLISADAAVDAVHRGALLIDIRTEDGVRRRGAERVPGTVIVDRDTLDVRGPDPTPLSARVTGLSSEIVVFCTSEVGSAPVVAGLRELGFTAVYHIRGGYGQLAPRLAESEPDA